jgi:hypothetical protein
MSVFLQSLGAPGAEIDQRSRAPRVLPPQFRVQHGPRGTAIAAQLHAMAVHSQQDTAALPASRPFAVGQAGYDYFADDQHYRSLADRVLAGGNNAAVFAALGIAMSSRVIGRSPLVGADATTSRHHGVDDKRAEHRSVGWRDHLRVASSDDAAGNPGREREDGPTVST